MAGNMKLIDFGLAAVASGQDVLQVWLYLQCA